jgi:YVTN family beta-propeller protein
VERFAAAAIACQNDAAFAAGGEGPTDFSVAPDSVFAGTWRLHNTGSCAWDPSYRLAFLEGERLNGPHSQPLGVTTLAGGEMELSVDLVAPANPGTYRGMWQLVDPAGVPFGVEPAVEIVVPSLTVREFSPGQIVAQIPAESGPIALGEGAFWILGGNSLSRVDLETNQVVATIPVGDFPSGLAIGYGSIWAAANGNVYRIDPLTDQVSDTIPLAPEIGLNDLAAGAGAVWASNATDGRVYRLDPNTNQLIAEIPVESGPLQIAATEAEVWVSTSSGLVRIDPGTNEISGNIPLDCAARALAADSSAVWVGCTGTPALFRVDPQTNQVVARIAVGYHPVGIASTANAVWVSSVTGNTLTQIDPATNLATAVYPVGEGPFQVIAGDGELFVRIQGAVWRIRP